MVVTRVVSPSYTDRYSQTKGSRVEDMILLVLGGFGVERCEERFGKRYFRHVCLSLLLFLQFLQRVDQSKCSQGCSRFTFTRRRYGLIICYYRIQTEVKVERVTMAAVC